MRRSRRGRRPKGRTSTAQSPPLILSSHSVEFGLSPISPSGKAGDPKGSQEHSSFVLGPAYGVRYAPRTAILLESRYSLSSESKTLSTANSSAQRGSKTGCGFRAQRTVTAQSTAQFFAPCAPHCGSAFAPPHFRRPLGFHLDFAHRKTSEIPYLRGRATEFS